MSRRMWIVLGAVVAGVAGVQWLVPHDRTHDRHAMHPPEAVSESVTTVMLAVTGMT